MKYRVLVLPCGSEIGLEINNALKYSTHVELFGASSVPNHGKYVYANYIEGLPNVESSEFIEKLNYIVKKHKIDMIFPAHDSVVLKLAQNRSDIACKIIGSSVETCEICRSKLKTYELFSKFIKVPHVYTDAETPQKFPVFLKPDVGQGSRGTYVANSLEEIEFYKAKDQSLLVLEFLPGKEYTIDCFTDKDGVLKFVGARQRARISNGISVNTFPVVELIYREIAEKINSRLVFRGMWFFQLKIDEKGELKLLEIAPRIAGSMALYRNLGVNFALLSIFDALDLTVSIEYNKYAIEMDRALFNRFYVDLIYQHVFVDFDDTIVLDDKINPSVMMFLFQCINKGIKIHLLSRHNSRFHEDVESVLKKYRIREIFDTIIDVKLGNKKSDYIKEKSAIFIDDSYAERREVSDKLKIPVFEVSSLESLISWTR